MSYNAEDMAKYEALINSSPLFLLDKEKDEIAYKRESRKMVEYLYLYLMSNDSGEYETDGFRHFSNEEFAPEIVETAKRCIENYNTEIGPFLFYFNSAWKQTKNHVIAKELKDEEFGGGHVSGKLEKNYKKYKRWRQTSGRETTKEDLREIEEATGLPVAELEELEEAGRVNDDEMQAFCNDTGVSHEDAEAVFELLRSRLVSNVYIDKDGEEKSVIDKQDGGLYADKGLNEAEAVREVFDFCEQAYNSKQRRQQEKLAVLLTTKLAEIAAEKDELMAALKEKAYFNKDVFEETLEKGEPLQHKEIAERLNLTEQSLSRTWNDFLDSCQEILKEHRN